MELIHATEIIRALDVILVKANCPKCNANNLMGFDSTEFSCDGCGEKSPLYGWDVEGASRRNLVAWGKGNIRRFPGKKTVQSLFRMQDGLCAYCDHPMGKYHVEHIIPLSFGGTNSFGNLALSCPPCNLVAGAKVFPSLTAKKIYILNQRAGRASA